MRRPGEAKVLLACHNMGKRQRGSLSSLELSINPVSVPPQPHVTNSNLLYVGFQGVEGLHCGSATDPEPLCARFIEEDFLRVGGGTRRRQGGVLNDSALEVELQQIREEVRFIGQRFRTQDQEKAACSEWKFAAAVIDRLCLVAFSVFTILCTIGILMSAPNFVEAISKDFFS